MQNEIMDAVTRQLFDIFGGGYAIYTDGVEQELKEPCFFVSFLRPSRTPLLGVRYRDVFDMLIQYFPAEEDSAREINETAQKLMDGMEYITLSDGRLRRGREMGCEAADGVLNFMVTYDTFGVRTGKGEEPMETVTVVGGCK